MVKGLSHKIIIVKSPNPQIFEHAIFIVRDDYLLTQGIGQKELMRQAKRAAKGYIDQTYGRKRFINTKSAAFIGLAVGLIGLIGALVYHVL